MRAWASYACALAWTAMAFAGCIEEPGDEKTADDDAGPETSPPGAQAGTMAGIVTNDEQLPIVGADVGLNPGGHVTTTDEGGAYSFTAEAGNYTLLVQRIGFASYGTKVAIVAGQTTTHDVTLKEVTLEDDRHVTYHFQGNLRCSFGAWAWVSPCDWPYTAVYYSAFDHGVNLSQYGLPAEPLQNRWRFDTNLTTEPFSILTEAQWTESTSAGSEELLFVMSCDEYNPVLDTCSAWDEDVSGPSPVRLEWYPPKNETEFMTRIYVPSEVGNEEPNFALVLEQKVDVYHTAFWGDKGWDGNLTALAPES